MLTGVITPPHVASWYEFFSTLFGGWMPWALWTGLTILMIGPVWDLIGRQWRGRSSDNKRQGPPWLAESLLCIFARTKDIDALMGDFEEIFARDCASGMSQRRAIARYWARVLRSIGPQMWQAIKRIGLLGLIAAALKR